MPDLLLISIKYGGYISPIKLAIFLGFFFLWLPLISWVYKDAAEVENKGAYWAAVMLATGAATAIFWLLVPVFVIGMLLYIIAVGSAATVYVRYRNTKVLEYDRVLTADHIKSFFSTSEAKKLVTMKSFLFITANNNEVPMPEPRTPEFYGYKAAYNIFNDATWRRASTIAFAPTHLDYKVTYYVDGAGLKQPSMPKAQMEHFIRFVKNLADLDTTERRKPQKGRFRIRQNENSLEWEVATAGSTAGEQVRLRLMTEEGIKKLTKIGLMPDQLELLNNIRNLKQGLFIVSGLKKTGVTTTFYALLRNHDAFLNSINTLERRPSADLPNITQQIFSLSDTGTTTFGKKLRSIIRMGPDIVGVADCQDTETAQVASEAAKDNKLIYLTLEADSVTQALGKWLKLVDNKDLAIETLLGISNQRLLRKLCNDCRQAYKPDQAILRKFNIPAEKAKVFYRAGKVRYDKRGKPSTCESCQGTGFIGRTAIFEIVIINDQLRDVIKQAKSISEISTHFRRAKMLYLQEQALRKVINGTTSINEMIRVLSKPKSVEAEKQNTRQRS